MLEDGEYAAWYKTPRGEGTGMIILAKGKLTGSDSVLAYSGSYEFNEDRFTAVVFTERHSPGQPSLFGIDNIELEVEGKVNGKTVACSGRARHAPEVPFHVTLIPVRNQPSAEISTLQRSANPTIEPRQQFTPRLLTKPL
jgi:hypothetical protein